MKIMFIGTGVSSVLGFRRTLMERLLADGHEVFALVDRFSADEEAKVRRMGVVPLRYTRENAGFVANNIVSCYFRMVAIIREIRPDTVFSYFAKPVVVGTWAAAWCGVRRRVGMLEGLGYYFSECHGRASVKRRLVKWMQLGLFHLSVPLLDKLVLLNPDDRQDLVARYKVRARSVFVLGGIGLRLEDFPYTRPVTEPVSFIFVGRLILEKGINNYLDAAEAISAMYPGVRCVVLGRFDAGRTEGGAPERFKDLEKRGVILYPGKVDNVNEWLSNASVFVLPSFYREGVPRSTQEAMSVGRPVITTDSPGCRETVIDGVNGFLIPPDDTPALLAAMTHFIEHPEAIVAMGERSRELAVSRFDADRVDAVLISQIIDIEEPRSTANQGADHVR
ncbi:glycosyltransferase family 4 protein [Halomonas sp. M4R5S39]|uniref:glycosyltransferase family 4 protein n=1 Tax=Halomonas kalidii TaxID=3043293 RepID=UPI0024A997DE|nr:glycosyltransferase family 4 protein [Halomonas kalidii]MDI5985640.1 glycosyltransferase family 4 protein [Halomonas kalidii]